MISSRFINRSSGISCSSIEDFIINEIRSNRNPFDAKSFNFEVIDYPQSKWLVVFGEFPNELEKLHISSEFIELHYFDECSPYLMYTHQVNNQCVRRIRKSTHNFDQERIDINDGIPEPWEGDLSDVPIANLYDSLVKHFHLMHPYNQQAREPRLQSATIQLSSHSVIQRLLNTLQYGSKINVIQIQIKDTTHSCNTKRLKNTTSKLNHTFLFEGELLTKEICETYYSK